MFIKYLIYIYLFNSLQQRHEKKITWNCNKISSQSIYIRLIIYLQPFYLMYVSSVTYGNLCRHWCGPFTWFIPFLGACRNGWMPGADGPVKLVKFTQNNLLFIPRESQKNAGIFPTTGECSQTSKWWVVYDHFLDVRACVPVMYSHWLAVFR